ncbi:hypothetical protein DPMN_067498 [Dreissena polymorpha]|uniref:Uncharacterized protein n=1 Tax=Dreissena polymorpha TaxID=45954 RepID=A0A9D3Z0U6_DREPO|nr:hypothetical protein DPMN_067498 [Dreissena polymorpha]
MEQPAGEVIEQVATESDRIAASDAILNHMTKGIPAGYSYALVEVQSGSQFATYVTPTVPVSQEALQVTGISMTYGTMTFMG